MARREITIDEIMEILRTTVTQLQELTAGVAQERLHRAPAPDSWSVNDVLVHLRTVQYVLGGNIMRIMREDHPAWKGAPGWKKETEYREVKFEPALDAFRAERAELLAVLEPLPPEAWERTATVTVPPNKTYERSAHFYGDWMAPHERSHLKHINRILKAVG